METAELKKLSSLQESHFIDLYQRLLKIPYTPGVTGQNVINSWLSTFESGLQGKVTQKDINYLQELVLLGIDRNDYDLKTNPESDEFSILNFRLDVNHWLDRMYMKHFQIPGRALRGIRES